MSWIEHLLLPLILWLLLLSLFPLFSWVLVATWRIIQLQLFRTFWWVFFIKSDFQTQSNTNSLERDNFFSVTFVCSAYVRIVLEKFKFSPLKMSAFQWISCIFVLLRLKPMKMLTLLFALQLAFDAIEAQLKPLWNWEKSRSVLRNQKCSTKHSTDGLMTTAYSLKLVRSIALNSLEYDYYFASTTKHCISDWDVAREMTNKIGKQQKKQKIAHKHTQAFNLNTRGSS